MTHSIARHRASAFVAQQGRCYYCRFQMWLEHPEAFAKEHGLTLRQALLFQCTAEHLIARQDGGTDCARNIVAACRRCNQLRHARPRPLDADLYRAHVARRLAHGRWHDRSVLRSGLSPPRPVH